MAKARKGMQPPPAWDFWDTAIVVACVVVAVATLSGAALTA